MFNEKNTYYLIIAVTFFIGTPASHLAHAQMPCDLVLPGLVNRGWELADYKPLVELNSQVGHYIRESKLAKKMEILAAMGAIVDRHKPPRIIVDSLVEFHIREIIQLAMSPQRWHWITIALRPKPARDYLIECHLAEMNMLLYRALISRSHDEKMLPALLLALESVDPGSLAATRIKSNLKTMGWNAYPMIAESLLLLAKFTPGDLESPLRGAARRMNNLYVRAIAPWKYLIGFGGAGVFQNPLVMAIAPLLPEGTRIEPPKEMDFFHFELSLLQILREQGTDAHPMLETLADLAERHPITAIRWDALKTFDLILASTPSHELNAIHPRRDQLLKARRYQVHHRLQHEFPNGIED